MADLFTLVRVTWADAHGSAANVAYELEEIPHAPVQVDSVGVLLKDDDIGVSIASEVCDKSIYRGYSFIPRAMVIQVAPIKSSRSRKVAPRAPAPADPR